MAEQNKQVITVAAAVIVNAEEQMLVVRKRGTSIFMQPGGKIDPGETPLQAMRRELDEEVSLRFEDDDLDFVGVYEEVAANEPNSLVKAHTFTAFYNQDVQPAAEIEDIRWIDVNDAGNDELALLTRRYMLPLARKITDLRNRSEKMERGAGN